jgi:hypothetical protein
MFIMVQNFLDAQGAEARPHVEIMISVAEQRLALVEDGVVVRKFPVSTSKFGLGDNFGSYKTPLGRLRVSAENLAKICPKERFSNIENSAAKFCRSTRADAIPS